MKQRIFAVLALGLFVLGLAVFVYSLIARTNDYAFYAVIFCAPGALMAFLRLAAQRQTMQAPFAEQKEDNHDASQNR